MPQELPDYGAMATQLLKSWGRMQQLHIHRQMEGFTQGEMMALGYLHQKGTVLAGELSEITGVSTARIAALLGTLERKGLVVRESDPEDRRRVRVCLTPEGVAQITAQQKLVHDNITALLTRLGTEDAGHFVRIMDRIVQLHQEKKAGAETPAK